MVFSLAFETPGSMTLEEFDKAMCALKIQRSPHCAGEKMRRLGEREWIEMVNMNKNTGVLYAL